MKRFKTMDLVFFSALAVFSEVVGNVLAVEWSTGFFFSFATVLSLIAMIRWGVSGVLVNVVAGVALMLVESKTIGPDIIYYVAANFFIGIPMLLYRDRDRDEIVEDNLYYLLFIISSHICLSIGKGIALLILEHSKSGAIDFFATTFLTLVINIIICLVLRTRKDLICDVRNYVKRKSGENYERKN